MCSSGRLLCARSPSEACQQASAGPAGQAGVCYTCSELGQGSRPSTLSPAGPHEGKAPVERAHHAKTFRPLSMLVPARSPVELVVVDGISPTQDACRDGLSGSTPVIMTALV